MTTTRMHQVTRDRSGRNRGSGSGRARSFIDKQINEFLSAWPVYRLYSEWNSKTDGSLASKYYYY